ncbi:MAG: hypothetical protein GXO60_07675 [Epsilonproteobacteria bacterium]|nr:hypothetical protein [Campylobacterota bacterium]
MKYFFISGLFIFLMSGCSFLSKKISITEKEPIIISDNPVVVQENIELKKLMRKFDYLIFTKLNLEAQEGEEDMFFDKNIQSSLKDFIKDSKKVEFLYPNADDEYIRLSKALNKEVVKLYKIVKIKKTEWVEPQVQNIINICNQCHSLYIPS